MTKPYARLLLASLGFAMLTAAGCGGSSSPKTDGKVDAADARADGSGGRGGSGGLGGAGGLGGTAGVDAGGGNAGGDAAAGTAGTAGDGAASDAADAGDVAVDGAVDGAGDGALDVGTDAARDGGDASDAGDAGDAGDAAEVAPPTCVDACTLAAHRCGAGGGTQTCVLSTATGCTVWNAETACGSRQTCSAGTCACNAAPTGCTAAGTFCDGAGSLVTCASDLQGCRYISSTATCPTHTSCAGTLPTASCACNNECTGTGAFCVDAHTKATCATDTNTPACHVVSQTSTCPGSTSCAGGVCVCPAQGTTAGTGCTTLAATLCSGDDVLTCVTQSSSNCSVWEASTHCGEHAGGRLTCGTKAGPPSCECPANLGTDVYVDPVSGSDLAAAPFPTGLQTPAACRFASLTKGLSTSGVARVIAISAVPPVTFTGETFPMVIPPGVTLTTADATPNAANYSISFDAAAATGGLTVGAGAMLRGFGVVDAGGHPGVTLVSCPAGSITLDTVALDGKTLLGNGVDLLGTCAATMTNVAIRNFAGMGVNANSSGSSTMTGGTVATSLLGVRLRQGSLAITGTVIENNGGAGIQTDTGTPSLTLTNATVQTNGFATAGSAGVAVSAGTLNATGTSVLGNGGGGISVAAGTTTTLTTVNASSNGGKVASSGVEGAGSLTATGLSATKNSASGVVFDGTLSLTGATLSTNAMRGLDVTGGTAVVSGGVIDTNTLDGIRASSTDLTVKDGADVRKNKTNGVDLLGGAGTTTTVAGAQVHENLQSGILVETGTGLTTIGGAGTTAISANGGAGILVSASPPTAGNANSLLLETVTISGNTGSGLYLKGDQNDVAATLTGSAITGNGDTGLLIEQGAGHVTRTAIQGNDISGNHLANGHTVGGILFNTSSTLTSFVGNKVHSNDGDELGFNAGPNAGITWALGPVAAGSSCNEPTANSLYCYGTGNVGLNVLVPAVRVDAGNIHWRNVAPSAGLDYTAPVTAPPVASQVDAANACPAVATCP